MDLATPSHSLQASPITQSLGGAVITSTRKDVRQSSFRCISEVFKTDSSAYIFPNDLMECDRLDLQHEALKLLHDEKIYFAPLKDPKRILDIGTGTGIWPIEMGECCHDFQAVHLLQRTPCSREANISESRTVPKCSYHGYRSITNPACPRSTKGELRDT
jgi:hypothetical protein